MYGFIITTAGEGLLARASAGEGLTITEVWVGKGTVESAAAAKALTALLDPVAQATSAKPAATKTVGIIARPSRPSVRLTALPVPTITK